MSASTEFATSLPFLGYKQRNAVLDNFFYDTTRLSLDERAKLTPLADREGSIIVVPPSNSDRKIRHYTRALRFMTKEGPAIRAIAVAGVGSSALGTAALARSIADALDADVAGIVTGYGLSDMMSEALGGWFAFGAADRIRHTMERAFARMRPTALAESVTPGSDAAATLSEILLAAPPKLDTLVAHSKGSLIVAHALQRYVDDLEGDDSPLFKRLHIVTLGAVVGVPAEFKHVKQYLGAYDWFGGANSSLGVKHERVPGVSHHLNPGFPYHMRVAPLLNGGAGGRCAAAPAQARARGDVPAHAHSAGRGAQGGEASARRRQGQRACAQACEENDQAGGSSSEGGTRSESRASSAETRELDRQARGQAGAEEGERRRRANRSKLQRPRRWRRTASSW